MEKDCLTIEWLPLFEKGLFEDNPLLFEPYFRNTQACLKRRYQQAQARISEFENTIRWPIIRGCGIQGATHPGAGKSFNNLMIGARHPVYNSDCIYINSARRIFAVSDSPGVSTFSRTLFEKLDRRLLQDPEVDWEGLLGHLDHTVARGQWATLALLSFDVARPERKAHAFVAGDTQIFLGNFSRRFIAQIEGQGAFFGRLNANPKMVELELEAGDFFVIASDGITSIRQDEKDETVESMLWKYLAGNIARFPVDTMDQCNRIRVEETPNGPRAAFGGNDDCSILLVDPMRLKPFSPSKSYLLGGCIY